jgi:hypothetical protein
MVPVYPGPVSVPATQEPVFELVVLFTGVSETQAALKKAGELASELCARITLLAPQVVPYPLPLIRPPVSPDFLRRQFDPYIRDQRFEVRIVIGLCRDREEFLEKALPPSSTLVMKAERRWVIRGDRHLVRRLTSLGHNVILV